MFATRAASSPVDFGTEELIEVARDSENHDGDAAAKHAPEDGGMEKDERKTHMGERASSSKDALGVPESAVALSALPSPPTTPSFYWPTAPSWPTLSLSLPPVAGTRSTSTSAFAVPAPRRGVSLQLHSRSI